MKFLLCATVFIATALAASQDEIDANKAIIENMVKILKDDSKSAEEKKTAYTTAIGSLQGDYKTKYDTLVQNIKTDVNNMPAGAAKDASQKFIAMFDSGELFASKDKVKAEVKAIIAPLTDAEKENLKQLQEKYGKEFKDTFKDIIPAHADPMAKSD